MLIYFNDALKSNITTDTKEDSNSVVITMNIHIEKEYYKKIERICKSLDISFGEFLNNALGEYYIMNNYDFETEGKRIKKLFPSFKSE